MEKTNDLGTVPSQIARPVLTNNSNPKKVINNKQDSNVIAIATEDETDDSAPSLATPSAASALTDTTKNRLSDNQQQQHRYSTYQPSYRSTVAEYYGSSYWENQNHPIYCSWNRTQHSPLNSAQNKVGALTSNTLPANYTSNSNSHITFRKEQTSVGSRAGGASLAATTLDTQSNCSLDTTTLSQHTNHLSSSLILTPANPVYLPTSAHISTRAQAAADNNTFLMSISPQGGVGSSGIAQGQLNANSAMIASAVSTTPSTVMQQFCCECAATQNRCSTDYCVCYASRRMCDEHCESARYRGDCLNQAICKCSCEVDSAKPAKNVCTKSERCDCLRMKEGCSKLCACKQVCKNREPPKRVQKVAKPTQGCQCAKAKKQCVKKECQCRSVYEFCSSSCKCAGDCSNGASKFHVPRHVQNCFLEHKAESSGLIVTLIGNDYIYRGDFYHESKSDQHVEEQLVAAIYDLISKYKVDLYDIVIFVSKSPCFHQDCEPKCEVVDECRSNRACAKLLGLLLSKIRKELSKVDVRMTAKFLYTHLNRGDLYTKQGILSMLQAGIKVEPLLMKDWSAIMDWSPHADHKGEYLQMWSNHNLDRSVAQSQSFINECRRALGLSMKFWVAEIHEIVTNTILYYSEIRLKCNELNDALKQLDLTATPHKIRSTPSKRRSFIDIIELRDKLLMRGTSESRSKTAGSNISVASDDAHAQAMVASFCGRSFDDNETNEIAQRIRRATTNINVEIETLLEFLTHKSATS